MTPSPNTATTINQARGLHLAGTFAPGLIPPASPSGSTNQAKNTWQRIGERVTWGRFCCLI